MVGDVHDATGRLAASMAAYADTNTHTLSLRFSATLGQEPEVQLALVYLLRARELLIALPREFSKALWPGYRVLGSPPKIFRTFFGNLFS